MREFWFDFGLIKGLDISYVTSYLHMTKYMYSYVGGVFWIIT